MKKTMKITLSALFAVILLISIAACEQKTDTEALWANASYASDATLGNGAKTVTVEIKAGERSVILTLKTDRDDLGAALFEHGLVNDPTFFDTCNGMKADYAKNSAYWAFKIDGKLQNNGIGDAKINGGEKFTLEYTTM